MTSLIFYDADEGGGAELLAHIKKRSDGRKGYRFLDLNSAEMHPCIGCFKCWLKTPGECIYSDDASRYVREIVNADKVLFLCPVTWGAYSPSLKILLDRSICRVLPFFERYKGETHHPVRYERSPRTWLVGYGKDLSDDESDLFRTLGENLDDNMQKGSLNLGVINGNHSLDILDGFFGEEVEL